MDTATEEALHNAYQRAREHRDDCAYAVAYSFSQMRKHRDVIDWDHPDSYVAAVLADTDKFDAATEAVHTAYDAWIAQRRANEAGA